MNHKQTTVLAEGRGPRGWTCMMFTEKKHKEKEKGRKSYRYLSCSMDIFIFQVIIHTFSGTGKKPVNSTAFTSKYKVGRDSKEWFYNFIWQLCQQGYFLSFNSYMKGLIETLSHSLLYSNVILLQNTWTGKAAFKLSCIILNWLFRKILMCNIRV